MLPLLYYHTTSGPPPPLAHSLDHMVHGLVVDITAGAKTEMRPRCDTEARLWGG